MNDYRIDSNITYYPRLDTALYWVVPNVEFPVDVNILKSNNNVAIEFFQNRIFPKNRDFPIKSCPNFLKTVSKLKKHLVLL